MSTLKKYFGLLLSFILLRKVVKGFEYYASDNIKTKIIYSELRKKRVKVLGDSTFQKKSKKVFIFGSGESIAHLDDEDWSHIKQFDTAALNYFYVHDFTPDFLFVELNNDDDLYNYMVSNCLQNERFSSCKLIFQYRHARDTPLYNFNYLNEIYSYVPYNYPTREKEALRLYLEKRKEISLRHLVHHASHVSALVDYCIYLGYEEIVLVGVDLNGGKYFYEVESNSEKYKANNKYKELDAIRKSFFERVSQSKINNHQSMSKELSNELRNLTIYDYFDVYSEFYGSKIKIYNSDSKLSEIFDLYEH